MYTPSALDCGSVAEDVVETSELSRGPISTLDRAGDDSDLCAAFFAATARANRSCNLSLFDLEGVVDRTDAPTVDAVVDDVDGVLVGVLAGRWVAACFKDSSSERILSRRASTPATAWDRNEPHREDFWGADISQVYRLGLLDGQGKARNFSRRYYRTQVILLHGAEDEVGASYRTLFSFLC